MKKLPAREALGAGMDWTCLTHDRPRTATAITGMKVSPGIFLVLSKELDALAQRLMLAFHDQMLGLELAASVLALSLSDLALRQTQASRFDLHDKGLAVLLDLRMETTLKLRPQVSPKTVRHKEPLSDCV